MRIKQYVKEDVKMKQQSFCILSLTNNRTHKKEDEKFSLTERNIDKNKLEVKVWKFLSAVFEEF